jgi:hypothetical protein
LNEIVQNIAIEIDGFDKAGKSLLGKYLGLLCNYKYTLNVRGILSQLVYNDKFNRDRHYMLYYKPLIILLDVEDLDHKVRCSINKEPTINIQKDREVFHAYANYLKNNGCTVLKYNTTRQTPFEIAENISKYLENLDCSKFICKEPILLVSLNLYSKEDLKNEDVYYGDIRE